MKKKQTKQQSKQQLPTYPTKGLTDKESELVENPQDFIDADRAEAIKLHKLPYQRKPLDLALIEALKGNRKLPDFLKVVGASILPFWQKHADSHPVIVRDMIHKIYLRANELRREHNTQHNTAIRPAPQDGNELKDWLADTERELLALCRQKRKTRQRKPPAEARLLAVLATLTEKRSIKWIAKEANTTRKTAHKSPLFLGTYRKMYGGKV